MQDSGKNAIFWSLTEKLFRQGLSFVVSIFLARLLNPDDFGVLAMATIFYGWVELFTDFGLGQSLIQKKEVSPGQTSTIFWINISIGFLLFVLFYIAAPWIADFFETPTITGIVRLTSVGFVITSFGVVQGSLLVKHLQYKKNFYISGASNVAYGIIGIAMAFMGYGVWSLVWSGIVSSLVSLFLLWAYSDWRPQWIIRLKETREMFRTGFHFMSFGFINSIFDSLDVLLFSKIYNPQTVGLYNRAIGLRSLPLSTFILPITRPLFPIFSKLQDDLDALKRNYFHYLHLLEFVSFATAGLIFLSASEIVVILYTDKWLVAADYLKYAIWIVPLEPNKVIITSLLKGMGKLKLLITLNFFERGIVVVALAVGYFFGIEWFLITYIFLRFCTLVQRIYYVSRMIGVTLGYHMMSLSKSSAVLLLAIFIIHFFHIQNIYISLIVKSSVFVLLYLGGSYLFKLKGLMLGWELFKTDVVPAISKFFKR